MMGKDKVRVINVDKIHLRVNELLEQVSVSQVGTSG